MRGVSQLRSAAFGGKVSCFTFSLWLSWFYLQLNKMKSTVLNANLAVAVCVRMQFPLIVLVSLPCPNTQCK